jgi:protein O-mannosyl-transferase
MAFFKNTTMHYAALASIALLLYANTLGHGFVLDDEVVILKNEYVQQGVKGIPSILSHDTFAGYGRVGEGKSVVEGGRYRPLSLIFFAIIYSLSGPNALVFHLFAILLYAGSCLLLYKFLSLMLKDRGYHEEIAWFATLLFAVHPVHTEVVANIKGCDEQLAFFFSIAALYAVFKSWDLKRGRWMIWGCIFFLLACLAKENAIMMVFIIPLGILFFRQPGFSHLLKYALPGIIASAIFLIIRYAVLEGREVIRLADDPLNNPFLVWNNNAWIPATFISKAATVLYTFGKYVWLLMLPYPLTHDYYPYHISLQNFTSPFVLISFLLLVAFIAYGILSIRRKGIAGFGILFFLISLSITSNILFPVGTFMAERFLFIPSAGFLLAISVFLVHLSGDRKFKFIIPVTYGIVILFGFMTIIRNSAWKNNETLLRTDAKTSVNSVKQQNDLGTLLLTKALQKSGSERQALMEESFDHLKFATDSHPTYYDAFLAYGAAAFYLQRYEESVRAYRRASELYPNDPTAKTGLLYAMQGYGIDAGNKGKTDDAIAIFKEAWQLQPDTTSAIELSKYYSVLNQSRESLEWLSQAVLLASDDAKLKYRLAKAYFQAGETAKADSVYQKAKLTDPSLPEL